MTTAIQIKVPDIGDFKDVEIIEILVKPGDVIAVEQALVSVESDKATLEIPSSTAGKIQSLHIKVGDKVSEGSLIATLIPEFTKAEQQAIGQEETARKQMLGDASVASQEMTQEMTQGQTKSSESQKNTEDISDQAFTPTIETDVLVLGAGPGGYSAAFRSADLGLKTVLVERYATLGGVCLNVGCIPSKALLHTAAVMDEAKALAAHGISFAAPKVDLEKLRDFKSGVVRKLTTGLSGMAKARKVDVIQGVGSFLDAYHLEVKKEKGPSEIIRFKKAIIAAGSQAVKPGFIPEDPRIVDSTGALALSQIPKKMLVIGGGIIGLEMATVYSTLGAKIDIVEMMDGLMTGADRDLVKIWQKINAPRFDRVMLKTKVVQVKPQSKGVEVTFEGEQAPKEAQLYDLVLVAVGRTPNGQKINADKAGVQVDARGFISVDKQQRTNVSHIFAVGDIVGQPMLAHKAVHEAHVAAEAAADHKAYFDAVQIPSVAYTDPEIAWAGLTEEQCQAQSIAYRKAIFPWAASGRAIANGQDEGFTKLLFSEETQRIIGGGIVGAHAGDLIGEICLAIEMGADAIDMGKTIHPHPTLIETIGLAAEVAKGVCTDLPPQKK